MPIRRLASLVLVMLAMAGTAIAQSTSKITQQDCEQGGDSFIFV